MKLNQLMKNSLGGLLLAGAAAVLAVAGSGCGEEPGPDDLLTLVELDRPAPGDSLGTTARARITFRDWFNGGLVIEARAVSSAVATAVLPLLAGEAEERAAAWTQVMAASASAGFSEQLVVGYQGLIREIELARPGSPGGTDSTSILLVAYLADIEEIEREDQPDSLVITPMGVEAGILNDVSLYPGTQAP
jgi:hypothetical protein